MSDSQKKLEQQEDEQEDFYNDENYHDKVYQNKISPLVEELMRVCDEEGYYAKCIEDTTGVNNAVLEFTITRKLTIP